MSSTLEPAQAVAVAKANLLSIFNERNATKRKQAMSETYAPDMLLFEPDKIVTGHDEISAIAGKLLDEHQEWSFAPSGKVFVNHRLVTLNWTFGPLNGGDVFEVGESGKIEKLWVMIEGVTIVDL
ncbi:hypothetical protein LTR53_003790 [Teratosphaeriaceae sp. CCFEE 6253]|nr:hypothetical protein LTR53_003790 [Teratosphaeriaceae sp. CCFEE 6253]